MALIDLGSGVKYEESTVGSGTGNYESFLRLAANGDEEGFNTDDNNEADNKDGIWTHSLQVANLQPVTIDGVQYYEIRLDLNEIQSGDSPNITLEDLRIFRSTDPADGDDFDNDFADLTEVFDLGDALALVDTNHGSGTDDYVFYLPVSLFPDLSEFLTLYADFSGSDDGFEEFRVLSQLFTPQPDIGVTKETNDTDDACPIILTGETVTWTYTVENNGNLPLSNVVVTDDNGTPLDTTDDFVATFVSGDTDGDNILDTTETWIFSASAPAQAGEYVNIATVSGDWAFGGNSGTVSGVEEDCYFGATPAINIVKLTNGTNDLCPVVAVGETVTWTYNITNAGDIELSNIVVMDDNGTPLDDTDDFAPDAVLGVDLVHNIGDVDNDGILDLTETWQYTASGPAQLGEYENIATVTGDATDDFDNVQTVEASEEDCYLGVEGPGVRTPGFWQNMNNGGQFWDGIVGNEKNAGVDCFADGELLYDVDSNNDGLIDDDDQMGLLIGDYNKNGLTDAGEDTLFMKYADARALVNASNKQLNALSGDGKFMLGRDMVATWLNFLAGNAISGEPASGNPQHYLDDSVDWMQIFSGTTNGGTGESFDTFKLAGPSIKTSSATWNSPQSGIDHSASQMHSALDEYNNFGTVNDIVFAHSCDNELFLTSLSGFSLGGEVSLI